jgi:hypothetical protein
LWSDHDKRLGINGLLLFGSLRTRHGSVFRPEIRLIPFPQHPHATVCHRFQQLPMLRAPDNLRSLSSSIIWLKNRAMAIYGRWIWTSDSGGTASCGPTKPDKPDAARFIAIGKT